jgi:ribose 1,5-bisphosphokinase
MTSQFSGVLFLIVGNSGSGKDTLLRWAVEHWPKGLPDLLATQRYITRPSSPETEDFISVSPDEFKDMAEEGAFTLQWTSYGLYYGVPREIEDHLSEGKPVIANVSRDILEEAREKFPNVKVIFVSVPYEILEERITSRGRENDRDMESRLARAQANQELSSADFVVENLGTPEEGGQNLLDILVGVVNGELA